MYNFAFRYVYFNNSWLLLSLAYIQECEEEVKAMGLSGPGFAVKSVVPRWVFNCVTLWSQTWTALFNVTLYVSSAISIIRSGRQSLCLQSFYTGKFVLHTFAWIKMLTNISYTQYSYQLTTCFALSSFLKWNVHNYTCLKLYTIKLDLRRFVRGQ